MALDVMHNPTQFTDADITDLCQMTNDDNIIHTPEMHKHGRQMVVPAMASFLSALALTQHSSLNIFSPSDDNYLQLEYAGKLISAGQKVTLGYSVRSQKPLEVRLHAFNHKEDLLVFSDDYVSRASHRVPTSQIALPEDAYLHILEAPSETSDKIQLYFAVADELVPLFFGIASLSGALLAWVRTPPPETLPERQLRNYKKLETYLAEGKVPVYAALNIQVPPHYAKEETTAFQYAINLRGVPGSNGRSIAVIDVICTAGGQPLYAADCRLIPVPMQDLKGLAAPRT